MRALHNAESFQSDHVVEVIRERDELLAELKKAMSTINGLRITLEEERAMHRKRNEDQLSDITRLDAENKALCEEVAGLAKGLAEYEKQSAKMTNHIEGLCREIEGLQKNKTSLNTEVTALTLDAEKTAKLLDDFVMEKAALIHQIDEGKDAVKALEKDLAASREDAGELRTQLDRVADFQQLLREKYPSKKKPQPKGKTALRHNVTVPPAEVAALQTAASQNPNVRHAMKRVPLDKGLPRDGDLASIEKFKWATPSANSQASILSRYYLPK